MRPASEFAPELVEMQRRRGQLPVTPPKVPVSLRFYADVVDFFKAQGAGWQARMNDALRKAMARTRPSSRGREEVR